MRNVKLSAMQNKNLIGLFFLYGPDERGLLFKLTHQRRCSYLHGAIALYMFLSLTRHYWDNEMILSIFSVEFRCAS